ncbi:type VI secretion system baseplate subunit TssE [Aquella oligotrophica]|uniref:Type VI secretion system baseplate subunit TssE n=1 Tax=Aquella oligotrophica TaxID=2067065 RepID=A0A2I7N9V8_9NEIS|nr:type VI secretion system baseplate subunit TssE [Aquella oligotrophica]AUR53065.1 type VI secretion system baseplate subunit TssE [Aquella oligotrophica]
MTTRTLFETFRYIEKTLDKQDNNSSAYIDSILEHLRNILNTRRGSVLIADNYGMPDLTNFPGENLAEAVQELEKMMRITIERYEPRLRNIKISYNPDTSDALTLKFGLSAELIVDNGGRQHPIFFETVITSDGMVKVER